MSDTREGGLLGKCEGPADSRSVDLLTESEGQLFELRHFGKRLWKTSPAKSEVEPRGDDQLEGPTSWLIYKGIPGKYVVVKVAALYKPT